MTACSVRCRTTAATMWSGWHRHPLGGNGVVESVAVIPHPDGDREEVWLSVKRTVDGAEVRHIEYQDDSGGLLRASERGLRA